MIAGIIIGCIATSIIWTMVLGLSFAAKRREEFELSDELSIEELMREEPPMPPLWASRGVEKGGSL